MTELNQLSVAVIGKGIEIHEMLGPGLLESSYKECLCYELTKAGLKVEREKPIPLYIKKSLDNKDIELIF